MNSELTSSVFRPRLLPGFWRYGSIFRPGYHCVFAGLPLGPRSQEGHFCTIAGPGGGKTLELQALMASVIPFKRPGHMRRFLFHDKKRDTLPFLAYLGYPVERVKLTDPFLDAGSRWDIAADISTPADAHSLSHLIIEEVQGDNAFFYDAARALVEGVTDTLQRRCSGRWEFRDLVQILLWPKLIRHVLSHEPRHDRLIEKYFKNIPKRVAFSVYETLDAKISPYELVAELWSHAMSTFSIREWLRSESVLILGNPAKHQSAVQTANKLIFTRLAQEILDGPDRNDDESWFALDELNETAQLTLLPTLMFLGRSKGARVAVAFQSMPALKINYKPDVALAIAGLCQNISFLRLTCPETAEWASRRIGEYESLTRKWHYEWTPAGQSNGYGFDYERVTAVYPSEFMNIPVPNDARMVKGCHFIPAAGSVFWNDLQYEFVPRRTCAYTERDAALQRPRPLDESDWRRLGLSLPKGKPPPPTREPRAFREPLPDDDLFS